MSIAQYPEKVSWDKLNENAPLFGWLSEKVLPNYLYHCRWFGGKAAQILSVSINDLLAIQHEWRHYYLLVLEVFFQESFAHHYFLPLALCPLESAIPDQAKLAKLTFGDEDYFLSDAVYDTGFHQMLFANLQAGRSFGRDHSVAHFRTFGSWPAPENIDSHLLKAEQSNSTIVIGGQFFLKIFRRLFRDNNPDFEMNEFFGRQESFENVPRLAGSIAWRTRTGFELSLGLMQHKVENEGDAWNWMLSALSDFFAKKPVLGREGEQHTLIPLRMDALPADLMDNPGEAFFNRIRKLARRTVEMHLALAHDRRDRNFNPVAYNSDFTVWLKNRLIYQFEARYNLLRKKYDTLPPEAQKMADEVLAKKDQIINFILGFDEAKLLSFRIRIHGDYHLGQILLQGDDFYILDFEGEPESTVRDRKVKQSPLKDVAGLFRSFHYAIFATLFRDEPVLPDPQTIEISRRLYQHMTGVFMKVYLQKAFRGNLDIGYHREIRYLLLYFLLEKAIYELGYELNGRPDWAIIPLRGIVEILREIDDYAY